MPLLHGQVFFVESVCDDPDVIAANILVSVIPVTCRHSVSVCVCVNWVVKEGSKQISFI